MHSAKGTVSGEKLDSGERMTGSRRRHMDSVRALGAVAAGIMRRDGMVHGVDGSKMRLRR